MAYGNFKDDQYPLVKDSFVNRLIARAIIIDDNKVFLKKSIEMICLVKLVILKHLAVE